MSSCADPYLFNTPKPNSQGGSPNFFSGENPCVGRTRLNYPENSPRGRTRLKILKLKDSLVLMDKFEIPSMSDHSVPADGVPISNYGQENAQRIDPPT